MKRIISQFFTAFVVILFLFFLFSSMIWAEQIHDATRAGNLQAIQELLDRNPTLVNAVDLEGWAPLHIAALAGNYLFVELLLSKGADPHIKGGPSGITALHGAALSGHASVVELLLSKRINVNARDNNGYTPLHVAASAGHKEIVLLLIKAGANINAVANNGLNPLNLAEKNGHNEVCRILLNTEQMNSIKSKELTERFARIEGDWVVAYANPAGLSHDGKPLKPIVIQKYPRIITLEPTTNQTEAIDRIMAVAQKIASIARSLGAIKIPGNTFLFGINAPGFGSVRLGYTEEHGIGFYFYPEEPFGWKLWKTAMMGRIVELTGIEAVESKEELARLQGQVGNKPDSKNNKSYISF